MASKADKFYFDNFSAAAAQSLKAAQYLVECLNDYHPENLQEMLTVMHEIEHNGDGKKHVKKVKRHVPPDVGAICFWLKNRKPEKFRDRPDAEKKPEEGVKVIIDV